MSLGREYETELAIEKWLARINIEYTAAKGLWMTSDARLIRVEDMTESHLLNCINMLKRTDETDIMIPWIVRMENELKRRGLEVPE